jgi:hypothetical protein
MFKYALPPGVNPIAVDKYININMGFVFDSIDIIKFSP